MKRLNSGFLSSCKVNAVLLERYVLKKLSSQIGSYFSSSTEKIGSLALFPSNFERILLNYLGSTN